MSVFDIAPTILHIYDVPAQPQMKGRVLTEIFREEQPNTTVSINH